jgi:hypothetical protein
MPSSGNEQRVSRKNPEPLTFTSRGCGFAASIYYATIRLFGCQMKIETEKEA